MPAKLYDKFVEQILELEDISDNNSKADLGQEQRKWTIPDGWTEPPTDIEHLGEPFDRDEIGEAYSNFFGKDQGTAADAMAAKLQSDYLASEERSFRLRHATHVRCGMHAAGRRQGHGDASKGNFARIANYILDVINS